MWQRHERLKARGYADPAERMAYAWAYYCGWHGDTVFSNTADLGRNPYVNASGAGYWDGLGDHAKALRQ